MSLIVDIELPVFYFTDSSATHTEVYVRGEEREGHTQSILAVDAFVWASGPSGPSGDETHRIRQGVGSAYCM